MTCSTSKTMGRGNARSIAIVPENVHMHVEGRFAVAAVGHWHAVVGAGAVMMLVVVAVLKTVTSSVEVGDRAVTVVVCPRSVDRSVTVVVIISVREGGRAVTVVVAYTVLTLLATSVGKRERVPRR